MKKSVLALAFVLAILVLPMVLAVQIDVKTLSGHKVAIFLRAPGTHEVLDFHQGKVEDGKISFESDFSKSIVDLQANVINSNGDYVIEFKRTAVDATGIIDLYLPSESGATLTEKKLDAEEEVIEEETEELVAEENGDVIEESEETSEEESAETEELEVVEENEEESLEEVVEEESSETSVGITGKAIEGVRKVAKSKTSYYVLGAILGLFALVFIIQVGRNKIGGGGSDNYKVVKYGSEDKRLAAAEKKLEVAKKELEDIKNRKQRLKEAKARFQKDRDELRRLEGEGEY